MRVFGALVILLAFTFFSAACYAAYQAPKWSGKPRREQRNYGDRGVVCFFFFGGGVWFSQQFFRIIV